VLSTCNKGLETKMSSKSIKSINIDEIVNPSINTHREYIGGTFMEGSMTTTFTMSFTYNDQVFEGSLNQEDTVRVCLFLHLEIPKVIRYPWHVKLEHVQKNSKEYYWPILLTRKVKHEEIFLVEPEKIYLYKHYTGHSYPERRLQMYEDMYNLNTHFENLMHNLTESIPNLEAKRDFLDLNLHVYKISAALNDAVKELSCVKSFLA
jgi:hypothetical protein